MESAWEKAAKEASENRKNVVKLRRALRKILANGDCTCGGRGYNEGNMVHIHTRGQGGNRFGHHHDCGLLVAARALGISTSTY